MRVLYFYPWGYFAPIRGGADVIAAGQLEYFRQRGWQVDCVLPDVPQRRWRARFFARQYSWLHSLHVVDVPGSAHAFRNKLFDFDTAKEGSALGKLLSEAGDLFFTNYVFTAPLVERLPRGCKRVLEAHDIMSYAFAIAEQTPGSSADAYARAQTDFLFRMEIDLYRLFDAVTFISADEATLVRPHLPERVHYVPPTLSAPEPDLVSEPTSQGDCYDLLFIGSDHGPNHRGIRWFYHNVFVPHL